MVVFNYQMERLGWSIGCPFLNESIKVDQMKNAIESKTLHMTLNKKWFDLILSGIKKEEYREIKPYWVKRIIDKWKNEKGHETITFSNGYSKDCRKMIVEFKSIDQKQGNPEWGAIKGKTYLVLELGNILSTKNC